MGKTDVLIFYKEFPVISQMLLPHRAMISPVLYTLSWKLTYF